MDAKSVIKLASHDTDTDILADILARIVAKMSVSVSWNAGLKPQTLSNLYAVCSCQSLSGSNEYLQRRSRVYNIVI